MAKAKKIKDVTGIQLTLTAKEAAALTLLLGNSNGDGVLSEIWGALDELDLDLRGYEYRYSHGHPGIWKV